MDDHLPTKVHGRARRPAARGQTTNPRPTVMVVDDYEDNRSMLRHLLEAKGYRVVEAADGLEAVAVAQSSHPNLILMDLSLPRLDGLAAMRRIRAEAALHAVPVVAVSGHVQAEDQAAALAAGFRAYITKPIDFEQLLALLKRLLP